MKTLKQISIFVKNKIGQLEKITKVLADNKINLLAINACAYGKYGMIKFIVNKPDLAYKKLSPETSACHLRPS